MRVRLARARTRAFAICRASHGPLTMGLLMMLKVSIALDPYTLRQLQRVVTESGAKPTRPQLALWLNDYVLRPMLTRNKSSMHELNRAHLELMWREPFADDAERKFHTGD